MEDRKVIARALATATSLHDQLAGLAHSTDLGINQLQEELHLTRAIKTMIEASNPSLDVKWPPTPTSAREELQQGAASGEPASVLEDEQEIFAHQDVFSSCAQGVIADPAAQLQASSAAMSCGTHHATAPSMQPAERCACAGTSTCSSATAEPATSERAAAEPAAATRPAPPQPTIKMEQGTGEFASASTSSAGPPPPQPLGNDEAAARQPESAPMARPFPPKMTLKTARVWSANSLAPAASARPPGDDTLADQPEAKAPRPLPPTTVAADGETSAPAVALGGAPAETEFKQNI